MNIEIFKKLYRVTELKHAYRINGIVDIWKNGKTVYDIVNNKYHNFYDDEKMKSLCLDLLETYKERPDYKKTEKGNMTLKELKNTLRNEKYDYNAIRAEDYHWKLKLAEASEDHLYFIIHGDTVKIGRSINPENRLRQLKTGFSGGAKMYVFFNKGFLEKTLHQCFSDIKKEGEWFEHCIRIKHFITKYHIAKPNSILV